MLQCDQLYNLAKCRYDEAKILLRHGKIDGAVYLCGYAIELMLKRRIVKVLNWDGFPEYKNEFKTKRSLRVHDLGVLLHFSGLEKRVQEDTTLFAKWQIASAWNSEIRYRDVGKMTQIEANDIITASQYVLNFILNQD